MRKIILIAAVCCVGCDSGRNEKNTTHPDFNTVVIDRCEYIVNSHSKLSALTHKGNCHNPEHQKP